MILGDVVTNLTEFASALPPNVASRLGGLITIFKAVGIAVVVYVIYVLVMGYIAFRRIKRMRYIEKKVDVIDKKLDKLLKKKH